jgi:hypothetical protein
MRAGRVVAAGPGRADTGEKKGGEGWGGVGGGDGHGHFKK